MNWQETVKSEDELIAAYEINNPADDHAIGCTNMAESQAKATWEARQPEVDEAEQRGIRKVVEYIENNINEVVELLTGYDEEARKQYHIAFDGFGKLLADWLRQAFLKGVEGEK